MEPRHFGLPPGARVICLDRSAGARGLQGIYRVDHGGRRLVVKVFGPKCGRMLGPLLRLDHFLTGRSSPTPRGRYRTESAVLDAWRAAGFDVFARVPDEPPMVLGWPHLALEYVPGRPLKSFFHDPGIALAAKLAVLRRFLPEWGRRHRAAAVTDDRRLIQEHASFKHVWLSDDGRLISFDFEEVFTQPHSIAFLIGREISGYLRSLYRVLPPEDFAVCLELVVAEYPHPGHLAYPYRFFFRHPQPGARAWYALVRRLPAHRKPNSRYPVVRLLQERLMAGGRLRAAPPGDG
jgi:hypothetical protein